MAQESPRLLSDFTPGLESQHTEWPWAQPGPYGLLKAWQRGRVIQEYGPNLSSCIEKIDPVSRAVWPNRPPPKTTTTKNPKQTNKKPSASYKLTQWLVLSSVLQKGSYSTKMCSDGDCGKLQAWIAICSLKDEQKEKVKKRPIETYCKLWATLLDDSWL